MSVIRVNKTDNFTVMSNYHLREKEMSLKAKGLLSVMFSLPNDWDYSINGLVAICKEGKDSITATLTEIEEFGYLVRTRETDGKGRFKGYCYDIYEYPQRENPCTENPHTDKPNTENPPQLNTKEINTKQSKNETKEKIYSAVVDYLNQKTGLHYRSTISATQRLIRARQNEGFTLDDFKKVIDNKCAEWLNSDMQKYLRPETLFGTKFESYLNSGKKEKEKFVCKGGLNL